MGKVRLRGNRRLTVNFQRKKKGAIPFPTVTAMRHQNTSQTATESLTEPLKPKLPNHRELGSDSIEGTCHVAEVG